MCKCSRHSFPVSATRGYQRQVQSLDRGLGRHSSGQLSARYGVRRDSEEGTFVPGFDPDELVLIPPPPDPNGLLGGYGGIESTGGSRDCHEKDARPVYVPFCKDSDEDSHQPVHLPEVCFSGYIIIRLAPGYLSDEAQTLEELAAAANGRPALHRST